MAKKVFVGVGHGGSDPGAAAFGIKEADANLVMALSLKEEMERHGVIVGISRMKDEEDPLEEEIREANAFAPDLAVECHNNAGGGDGFEVFYQTNGYKTTSLALAQAIEAEIKKIGQNSRGCKTKLNSAGNDYFGWLRQLKCPAVLCEGFFVDSADRYIADTEAEQKAFGVAYAKGVLARLGISYREPVNNQAAQEAINKLAQAGVINTPSYWQEHVGDLQYLDQLIINIAGKVTASNSGATTTAVEAINKLAQAGAISTPSYWMANVGAVLYLDKLLINAANHL
jgi:N-acetylmuramoyl-L-alanine amidase